MLNLEGLNTLLTIMTLSLKRTNAENSDFISLVSKLDAYLSITDGDEHSFYDQFNKIDSIKHVVVAYVDARPVACGAIKQIDLDKMEVKRMYVMPLERGRGYATKILKALEEWTTELGFKICVLETGKRQKEAVALYEKNNYKRIANYGQYTGVDNSICFQKKLSL